MDPNKNWANLRTAKGEVLRVAKDDIVSLVPAPTVPDWLPYFNDFGSGNVSISLFDGDLIIQFFPDT